MNVLSPSPAVRTTRLTVLVSAGEAAEIARRAEGAGLSVSAYLRACALGPAGEGNGDRNGEDAAALRHVDTLLGRMEADLDGALAALAASLAPTRERAP
ncbi:MAG: plasmid mobilization protein [Acetobacteraceae bacterium]